ncbi:MAG: glucose-1-phosphate adenylyltransferase [Myxococcales bacterium]|nr:glucose-1-phosphate adenylyltransferase [Myxococcales bacterium]
MLGQPIVVILGGGTGSGLFPLTRNRSKAAVPIAGKYRLIDIPLSNCLLSELYHIFVLTQYNSGSLNRHIAQTFQIPPFLDGFVEVRAASLTEQNPNWYQGTADSVRQNLQVIQSAAEINGSDTVLILSGDHLYQMDYRELLAFHRESGADVTISVAPASEERATSLGIVRCDEHYRVQEFLEKPNDPEQVKAMAIRDDEKKPFWGSMGIYVFRLSVLEEMLQDPSHNEFGRDILPKVYQNHSVAAYPFKNYWENVGTIKLYYEAMLELTRPEPGFRLFERPDRNRFFTRGRSLPSAKVNGATMEDAVLAEGAIIDDGAQITRSLVGTRAFLGRDVEVRDAVIFGADFYEPIEERNRRLRDGEIPLGIGERCILRGCIIDKNVRIGRDVVLENTQGIWEADHEKFFIREGIIVVPKEVVIEDGFRMPRF